MIRITCIVMVVATLAGAAEPEIKELTALAESGDTEAMVTLGMRYRDGEGVERDRPAAVRWYRKAVDAGSKNACDHLGFMYMRSWGVRRDFAEARKLFEKAEKHSQALYNLGRIYGEGLGVEVDLEQAERLWNSSRIRGNRHAPLSLALMEWHRDADRNTALMWVHLLNAAQRGNAVARRWMGYIGTLEDENKKNHVIDPDAAIKLLHSIDKRFPINDPERATLRQWYKLRTRKPVPNRFVFIDLPHRTQGLNMCAPTAAALALSTDDKRVDPYEVKAKCTGSPRGTGTDWALLVAAIREYGRDAKIVTFPHTDAGFDKATAALRTELDAGRQALIDVIEPSRVSNSAHTVVAVGYDKDKGVWILHDPAEGPPGLWIVSDARLKIVWHSRWWTKTSTGYARPMITISR